MITTLIEVSIPAVALIIVQIIINSKQQRIQDVKFENAIKTIDTKFEHVTENLKNDIKRLEVKQEKHNNLIERITILEQSDKTQWLRIDEMKSKIGV